MFVFRIENDFDPATLYYYFILIILSLFHYLGLLFHYFTIQQTMETKAEVLAKRKTEDEANGHLEKKRKPDIGLDEHMEDGEEAEEDLVTIKVEGGSQVFALPRLYCKPSSYLDGFLQDPECREISFDAQHGVPETDLCYIVEYLRICQGVVIPRFAEPPTGRNIASAIVKGPYEVLENKEKKRVPSPVTEFLANRIDAFLTRLWTTLEPHGYLSFIQSVQKMLVTSLYQQLCLKLIVEKIRGKTPPEIQQEFEKDCWQGILPKSSPPRS